MDKNRRIRGHAMPVFWFVCSVEREITQATVGTWTTDQDISKAEATIATPSTTTHSFFTSYDLLAYVKKSRGLLKKAHTVTWPKVLKLAASYVTIHNSPISACWMMLFALGFLLLVLVDVCLLFGESKAGLFFCKLTLARTARTENLDLEKDNRKKLMSDRMGQWCRRDSIAYGQQIKHTDGQHVGTQLDWWALDSTYM